MYNDKKSNVYMCIGFWIYYIIMRCVYEGQFVCTCFIVKHAFKYMKHIQLFYISYDLIKYIYRNKAVDFQIIKKRERE